VEANHHGVVNKQPATVVVVFTNNVELNHQVATHNSHHMEMAATHTEVNNSLLMAANKDNKATKDTE
jgi:acetyl-CoA carboxylase beta subunit